jgi:hypothetical protein
MSLVFGKVVEQSRVEWLDVWVFALRVAALKAIELDRRFAPLGTRALRAVCLVGEVFQVEVVAMGDCGRMRFKTDGLRSSLVVVGGRDEFLQSSFEFSRPKISN